MMFQRRPQRVGSSLQPRVLGVGLVGAGLNGGDLNRTIRLILDQRIPLGLGDLSGVALDEASTALERFRIPRSATLGDDPLHLLYVVNVHVASVRADLVVHRRAVGEILELLVPHPRRLAHRGLAFDFQQVQGNLFAGWNAAVALQHTPSDVSPCGATSITAKSRVIST